MRNKGKITHWNEEKGYGFITPASGAKRVFVHISAFSNSYLHPRVGQLVTFSVSTDKSGRPRAEDVIGAEEPAPRIARRRSRSGLPGRFAVLFIVLLVAAVAYSRFNQLNTASFLPFITSEKPASHQTVDALFRCDGRTRCSQMTSCDEAMYFSRNCPDTAMDGDQDGIPCETQWCD